MVTYILSVLFLIIFLTVHYGSDSIVGMIGKEASNYFNTPLHGLNVR